MNKVANPFSYATVVVSEDYLNTFPQVFCVVPYLHKLFLQLDVEILTLESPITVKAAWSTVMKMNACLKTLLTTLNEALSKDTLPNEKDFTAVFMSHFNVDEIVQMHDSKHFAGLVANVETVQQVEHGVFEKNMAETNPGNYGSGNQINNVLDRTEVTEEDIYEHFVEVTEKESFCVLNGGSVNVSDIKPLDQMAFEFNSKEQTDCSSSQSKIHDCVSNKIPPDPIVIHETLPQGESHKSITARQPPVSEIQQALLQVYRREKKKKVEKRKMASADSDVSKQLDIEVNSQQSTKLRHTEIKIENYAPRVPCLKLKFRDSRQSNKCDTEKDLSKTDSQCIEKSNLVRRSLRQTFRNATNNADSKGAKHKTKKINKTRTSVRKSNYNRNKIEPNKKYLEKTNVTALEKQRLKKKINKKNLRKSDEKLFYKCNLCSFETIKIMYLHAHKKRAHMLKNFTCCECEKDFGHRKDLTRHLKCHQKPEHCCDVCGKVYKEDRRLKAHKLIHEADYIKPEHPCKFCSKSFSTKYNLATHLKSDHLGMKRSFVCPTCGHSFSQKHAYLLHARIHLGIRPFICEICGKTFAYQKSLREHTFLHSEHKTFVCTVCNKAFKQASGLFSHMKNHKATKDYVCSKCGKGFRQRQALVRHERIHAGEKPYECCLCKQRFADSSVLRRHMILIHKKTAKDWKTDTKNYSSKKADYFINVLTDNDGEGTEQIKSSEKGPASNIISSTSRMTESVNVRTARESPTLSSNHFRESSLYSTSDNFNYDLQSISGTMKTTILNSNVTRSERIMTSIPNGVERVAQVDHPTLTWHLTNSLLEPQECDQAQLVPSNLEHQFSIRDTFQPHSYFTNCDATNILPVSSSSFSQIGNSSIPPQSNVPTFVMVCEDLQALTSHSDNLIAPSTNSVQIVELAQSSDPSCLAPHFTYRSNPVHNTDTINTTVSHL